jgi:hypothetical protein
MRRLRRRKQALHLREIGHICRDRLRLPAIGAGCVGHATGLLGINVADRHPCALGGEAERDGAADVGSRPGHDHAQSCIPQIHAISPFFESVRAVCCKRGRHGKREAATALSGAAVPSRRR